MLGLLPVSLAFIGKLSTGKSFLANSFEMPSLYFRGISDDFRIAL